MTTEVEKSWKCMHTVQPSLKRLVHFAGSFLKKIIWVVGKWLVEFFAWFESASCTTRQISIQVELSCKHSLTFCSNLMQCVTVNKVYNQAKYRGLWYAIIPDILCSLLDCAVNDSHSARALIVLPYLAALTEAFDGISKPADGSRWYAAAMQPTHGSFEAKFLSKYKPTV